MKSNRSFKPKTKYVAAAVLVAAYFLGFAARVYSPAHIGHLAIPIPTLIPLSRHLSSDNPSQNSAANLSARTNAPLNFTHNNIITTFFWVGEPADSDNGNIANSASAWDGQWEQHYGGVDDPTPRQGFYPAGFTPKENPFYIALPYDDIDDSGDRKASASHCPLVDHNSSYSWCKNSWVAIRHSDKVVYAQWEDAGPFGEDDTAYVFGSAAPKNQRGAKAGLDVSPAVRDYLDLQDVDRCDWTFVNAKDVTNGPWKQIVTTSKGYSVN